MVFDILIVGDFVNNNLVIEREKKYIDEICDRYRYDSNIRHLLYIIIPAFIIKYGVEKEKLILNTFRDIRIIRSNEKDEIVKAYFSSRPVRIGNEVKTEKYMVIQNYDNISLVDLLDNLVHEFNHAINSYINEIRVTKKYIYLRTGLTFRIYRKEDLSFIKKQNSYILEEIINTKQTSDIINIIKKMSVDDSSISNTIYAINSETGNKYLSNSYYLQSYVCKEILANRTFLSTLENLRINGEVYDIQKWFDDIIGEEGTYFELTRSLREIYDLELEYVHKRFFKSITLGKIRDKSNKILRIIEKFNRNVNYR